jgi:hypothetical protein
MKRKKKQCLCPKYYSCVTTYEKVSFKEDEKLPINENIDRKQLPHCWSPDYLDDAIEGDDCPKRDFIPVEEIPDESIDFENFHINDIETPTEDFGEDIQ